MIQNQSKFADSNLVPFFLCSDEVQLTLITGLLEENNIEIFVETEGLDEEVHKIYVRARDLSKSERLLQNSQKAFSSIEHKDNPQIESIDWGRIVLRTLLVLTSLFFGMLSYYTLLTSEKVMGIFLCGISVFFLSIFIFSFDWSSKA